LIPFENGFRRVFFCGSITDFVGKIGIRKIALYTSFSLKGQHILAPDNAWGKRDK
jgi:hypothetical protein